jgi:glutamate carboxypeptidase
MSFAGVREVGRILDTEFAALGFRTHWVDGAPFGRAGHLIAEWQGRRATGPHVLLIGHLDTVFERDSPFQRFERLEGQRARGPGIIDMKGGDVVMLLALGALRDEGLLDGMRITVVLTGDEENEGEPRELSRADLIAAGEAADVALGFEDGDGKFENAVVARRGSSSWRLEAAGKPAHSSLIFREDTGFGAIYEVARILDAFRSELVGEAYLTFNPGLVLGGNAVEYHADETRGSASGKANIVAGKVVVAGDLRALSPEQLERTRERMRAIVAQNLPRTSAEIIFQDGYPPMAPTAGNRRLLEIFDHASRDLGMGAVGAVDPMQAGAADISFVAGSVEMALDGLGLAGTDGHTVQETADLASLGRESQRVALLLKRLAEAPRAAVGVQSTP